MTLTLAQSKARGAPSAQARMLSVHDVIATTSFSRATIYRLIKSGDLPAGTRVTRGRVVWWEDDILKFLARHRPR